MTKAYETFLSEPLTYSLTTYGEVKALAMRGSRANIERAHMMFCNIDGQKKLVWLKDTNPEDSAAFISTTLPRIKKTIKTYLYGMIVRGNEIPKTPIIDPEDGESYDYSYDERLVEDMADADANDFISRLQAPKEDAVLARAVNASLAVA